MKWLWIFAALHCSFGKVPSLRLKSFAIINLRSISEKLNDIDVESYKELLVIQLKLFVFRIDFTTSNLNDENLNKLTADKIPDVVRQFFMF